VLSAVEVVKKLGLCESCQVAQPEVDGNVAEDEPAEGDEEPAEEAEAQA